VCQVETHKILDEIGISDCFNQLIRIFEQRVEGLVHLTVRELLEALLQTPKGQDCPMNKRCIDC
jgi:hypothetical protein